MLSPHQETFYDKIPLKDVCPELSQLQKESKIVDLTLKTQDGLLLNVHRIIFAARLPKLKDYICSSATSTIDWSRFPQKSVRALTTYVYTGRLEVSTRTSQSIYLLAASVELEHDSEALELAASLFHLIETKRSFKHPTEASYVLRTTYALTKRFNDLNSLAKSLNIGEHVSELLNQAENAVDVDVSSNTDSGHLNSVETDRRIAAELTTMLS
ncbi:hypothetical protein SprV_0502028600 [Sparganum proliferum]